MSDDDERGSRFCGNVDMCREDSLEDDRLVMCIELQDHRTPLFGKCLIGLLGK